MTHHVKDAEIIIAHWIASPSDAHTSTLRPEHMGRLSAAAAVLQSRGSTPADVMAALASDGDPTGVTAYNDLITLSVGLLPAQVADTEARIRHATRREGGQQVPGCSAHWDRLSVSGHWRTL